MVLAEMQRTDGTVMLLLPVLLRGPLEAGSLSPAINVGVSGKCRIQSYGLVFFIFSEGKERGKPAGWDAENSAAAHWGCEHRQHSPVVAAVSVDGKTGEGNILGRCCLAVGTGGAGPQGAGSMGWKGPGCGVDGYS